MYIEGLQYILSNIRVLPTNLLRSKFDNNTNTRVYKVNEYDQEIQRTHHI